MPITAYLRNSDGAPVVVEDWYFGRFLGRVESTMTLNGDYAVGDRIEAHAGFGMYHTYEVAALDDRSAILVLMEGTRIGGRRFSDQQVQEC